MEFVIPQFEHLGYTIYLDPFLHTLSLIEEWWFLISTPILLLTLPILIHKRYGLFQHPPAN